MEPQDKQDKLRQKIINAQAQADSYFRHIEMGGEYRSNIAPEAVEAMLHTLEELSIAEEELRVQNNELANTRLTVEAQRARYLELFEFAPDGYLVTDPQGVIREANRSTGELLNIPADQLVGKAMVSYIRVEDRKAFLLQLNNLPEIGLVREWDISLQPREGEALPVAMTVAVMPGESERTTELRWMLRDTSERVRTEKALQESEEILMKTQEIAHISSRRLDFDTNPLVWSDEVFHIFGLLPENIGATYEAFLEAAQPEDRQLLNKAHQNAIKAKLTYVITRRVQRPDGTNYTVHEKSVEILNEAGEVVWSYGLANDITEQVQDEKNIQRWDEKLEEEVDTRTHDRQIVTNPMIDQENKMIELKDAFQKLRNQLIAAGIEPVADDPLATNN